MATWFWSGLLILAINLAPRSTEAQTRATSADLTGVVLDESRGILAGATVTATNAETNLTRLVVADAAGRFSVPALPPGIYTVKAELPGFATQTREGIVLPLGTAVAVDFTLRIAGTREEITVSAAAPLIDTQQTAVSTVVSQQQIESLPINGRNFISFSVITPGVSTDQTPQQGASATSGLTFAGQRARSNNITVDGLDNNDITIGSVRADVQPGSGARVPGADQFVSAEFGKASGGVVNIVTKSGTNPPSGNAFFYGRDKALNAKNYFEKFDPVGSADRSREGAVRRRSSSAAPSAVRSKRTRRSTSCRSSARRDASNFVNIDDTTLIIVPGRTASSTPRRSCAPPDFPSKRATSPTTSKQLVPGEGRSSAHHRSAADAALQLRRRVEREHRAVRRTGGQSRAASLDSRDYMMAASHTAVISDRIVNELRFQFARRDQKIDSLDPNVRRPVRRRGPGRPDARSARVASVGRQRFTPQPRLSDRYQVLDTISLFAGRHQLKAGIDFNYVDHKNAVAAAAFRRTLHFRAAAGDSWRAAGAGHRASRRSRSDSGGLRAGLRRLRGSRTAIAICRSLRRTTGA